MAGGKHTMRCRIEDEVTDFNCVAGEMRRPPPQHGTNAGNQFLR